MSSFRSPNAEAEFENLGVSRINLETAEGSQEYSVTEFCDQLPTAERIARSYGVRRTAALLAKQKDYTSGLNYPLALLDCLTKTATPLPYSVAQVLIAQLAYGVREEREIPPGGPDIAKSLEVSAATFLYRSERQIYRDPNISEAQHAEVLKSGLVTLVGATLAYQPVNPYESLLILREREVRVSETETETMLTIPGGHAMHPAALAEAMKPIQGQLDRGKDGLGHTLVDVTGLREKSEETGLAVKFLRHARPLTIADQVMRNSKGEIVRYLGFIWENLLWDDAIAQLQDGDGQGKWRIFGPGEEDVDRHSILAGYKLTPIARIALKNYRE